MWKKINKMHRKINKDIYNSWGKFKENARLRSPFNEHGYANLSNSD